jgi:signal transduction histidine kinase
VNRFTPSNLTIRARLTLVYGGLFLLAGVLLLAVTYALVSQRMHSEASLAVASSTSDPSSRPSPPGNLVEDGQTLTRYAQEAQQDVLDSLLTQGAIALVVVGAAAVAFGWLIAGRLLQPLHRVTETARRIARAPAADRSLHERIALEGPHDEIKELGDTFDLMVERLDQSFDGQRRFIANASHELRTPLTLNRTLLEIAVQRPTASPDVLQLGENLLEINARHERLIDGLLLLARSERELTEKSYVDLADIVDHVVDQTPSGGVRVDVDAREAATTGNPVLLERLVQNLVENGVRHNVPTGGWVGVRTRTAPDGSAVLEVTNTGPAVPRYDLPALFEPFRRLTGPRLSSTAPGAGLGLSIVRAVAGAHGGDVHVEPREGGGLIITTTLPGPDGHHTSAADRAAVGTG